MLEVIASATRTPSTTTSAVQVTRCRGIRFYLNISAVVGTPTVDVKVQTLNPLTGTAVDLPGASFAQQTGATTKTLTIYPGIGETANETVSDVLSNPWQMVAVVGATTSATFSVGAEELP